MSWSTLSTQLYTLLNANKATLDVQEVINGPSMNLSGYPAITVTPSEVPNDYLTTSENERVYAWRVRIFYEVKDTGLNQAVQNLYTICDAVSDILDQEAELNSSQTIGQNMPARYTYINLFATPSSWGLTEDEALVFTELSVKIRVSVDVT